MEFYTYFQALYSLAEGYGIPSYAVNIILVFALVLILGRPIISLFLRVSYKRLSELSPETRYSYIGIIHIVALVVATLSALLDLRLAAALTLVFLVIVPLIVGFVASRKERKGMVVQSISVKETTLRQALRGKKREEPKKKQTTAAPTKEKKKINIKFRFPSISLPKVRKQSKERKGGEKKQKVKQEHEEPALVVEEITFWEKPADKKKTREKPSKQPVEKKLPHAEAVRIKEFRKAVSELEALASGRTVVPAPPVEEKVASEPSRPEPKKIPGEQKVVPAPKQKTATAVSEKKVSRAPPSAPIDESALVKKVEKVVEEKVISARRHRFITWREVLEMRKKAKETVKRMEPVVKEHVRRRLQEKGRITKEDLDEIAEEILYQIQRSEALAEPSKETKTKEAEKKKEEKKEKPRRRHREEKKEKEKKEEDLLIGGGEEDILAILGGEESTEEDIGGDLEELEKLLGSE